jgi:hypothetical protein
MIQYKDFAPQIAKRGPFGGPAEFESFSDVVSAANQWVENGAIQVINVETVVLPDSSKGTSEGIYTVTIISGNTTINGLQCVRIWYRE